MILVVCPNLAVDITLHVDALEVGAVHRARASTRQAGGKGVNVARALRALGEEAVLVGYAGGRAGEEIAEGLQSEGIRHDLIPFSGESRTCTILLGPDGTATVVNEAGPSIEDDAPLIERFDAWTGRARSVALMGSLPPGLPARAYAKLVERAKAHGLRCLLDTSGEALEEGLRARPDIVKPNRGEAEELFGRKLDSRAAVVEAVREIQSRGIETVLLTLGSEGFLVAEAGVVARCSLAVTGDRVLANPTGAGDALAAGFLAGTLRGYSLSDRSRLAAAAAAASLARGYGRFRARDVRVEAARFELLSGS
jgi:tagatose 6-phosphate kinase